MNPVARTELNAKLRDVTALCQGFHVRRLALFGSAASGSSTARIGDHDFLVEFMPLDPVEHFECYFGLIRALEELLGTSVDLVEYSTLGNPYFRKSALSSQVVLYESA